MKKLVLVAVLVAAAALPLACMKEPELVADFGPEVSDEAFSKMVKPEPPSFNTVQANEYAYATRETLIDGRPFALNNRWAFTITSRTEQPDRYVLGINHELHEYVQGEEKVSTRKADIAVSKVVSAPTTSSVTSSHYPNRESAQRALADQAPQHPAAKSSSISFSPLSLLARASLRALETPPVRRTIHNLTFSKGTYPVPDFVRQRPNCGGLPQNICQGGLKAFYLSFDQVDWAESGGQRYTVSRVYSSEVPFFASTLSPLVLSAEIEYFYPGILEACVKTDMPYNGITIQLTQCDKIKDFTFGHP